MKHEIFIASVFLLSRSGTSNSFETPWSVAHQAPLSMGILQARILSRLPRLPSGDLPNPGIEPRSPTLQTDPGKPSPQIWNASWICISLLPVQFSSVAQVVWLWDPMDWSTPGFPSPSPGACSNTCPSHWCHLILSHPLLLLPSIFTSIRVFSNESVLSIRWPKYWTRAK